MRALRFAIGYPVGLAFMVLATVLSDVARSDESRLERAADWCEGCANAISDWIFGAGRGAA